MRCIEEMGRETRLHPNMILHTLHEVGHCWRKDRTSVSYGRTLKKGRDGTSTSVKIPTTMKNGD